MEFSIRRVNSLFKKEVKDIFKNINVLLMCVLPIAFSIIYSKLFSGKGIGESISKPDILLLCLGMNLVLASIFIISMLIAEEKEKNTLRTLMLSGVSPWEFLSGKAILTLLLSVVVNVAMFFIVGIDTQYLGKYILLTLLVVLSMIEIGAVIGMLAPNQMATGVIGMPLMLLFLLIPMFAKLSTTIKKIAEFLPNYNMNLMLEKVFKGEVIGTKYTYNISIILIWIIIGAVAFAYTYAKKGLDK